MKHRWTLACLSWTLSLPPMVPGAARAESPPHSVLLFVADGLRPGMITPETAPALYALEHEGVRFANTHSMFPTFTTANASAMATGHKLGDTGDFSNTIDAGFQVPGAGGSLTPFLESDPVLGDVDEHFEGDYLNQETVMKAARLAGMSTATIGKLGPSLIFDHTSADANKQTVGSTIVVDDSTGHVSPKGKPIGIPLDAEMQKLMTAAALPLAATPRGANAKAGDFKTPGTLTPNTAQQDYFVAVATKVVLPLFKQRAKPFMMVFWSRDPDGTQHNQGDSLNTLTPGIDGPTSVAAIKNADHDLATLLAALKAQGLDKTTDVIVASDHGFSTISKDSKTSFAATQSYGDVVPHFLPPGFLALDIAHGLDMPLLDPDAKYAPVATGSHPSKGNGLIGGTAAQPKVVVAANGGSDLVYLPDGDKALARKVVDILSAEDYVSGLFVSETLGTIPGTLPIAVIDLQGSAVTPIPSIVVNFRSFTTGCKTPLICGAEIADTGLQQGQGMHGSFSRADTATVGGASGPDFKSHFVDEAPTSNADLGKTMAHILQLQIPDTGKLVGRVLTEAFTGGKTPAWQHGRELSAPDAQGHRTVVEVQTVGGERYFDAAGYAGRTLGLTPPK
ncbi:alkaline phosphatase family protein [Acidisoma sp. 7E03]